MNIQNACKEKYHLIHDKKYLNWLKNFVAKNGYVDTDIYGIVEKTGATEEDILNIKKISDLFYEISNYALSIYVYSTKEEFGEYYVVKIDDGYYIFGVTVGQGSFCYVNRAVKNEITDDNVVDITDLTKINYRAALIEENLKSIIDMIEEKRKFADIPLEAIKEEVIKYVESKE